MTDEKKPIVQEVQAPPIDPMPKEVDPLQQILQGMLQMQQKTNDTLEKITEKLDEMSNPEIINVPVGPKTEEEMVKEMNNVKIIQRKMYKVLVIKSVLPMAAIDQQMHGEQFANGGVVWGDTNKRFDSEQEANAYGNEIAPGKFKLMPVTVPVPEGQDYKKRRPNLTI